MSVVAYLIIFGAYLLSSIASAVIFCALAGLPDPRTYGSNKPSLSNVLRQSGKIAAFGVLLLDILKGLLPVSLGFYLALSPTQIGFIALASCLGHVFPLFFKLRGGKGVATAFGAILPMDYTISALAFGTWLLVFLVSRYTSLSAVMTALIAPFYVWWFKPELTFPVTLVCCLLVYRHHDNIQRLWRGQEQKMDKL